MGWVVGGSAKSFSCKTYLQGWLYWAELWFNHAFLLKYDTATFMYNSSSYEHARRLGTYSLKCDSIRHAWILNKFLVHHREPKYEQINMGHQISKLCIVFSNPDIIISIKLELSYPSKYLTNENIYFKISPCKFCSCLQNKILKYLKWKVSLWGLKLPSISYSHSWIFNFSDFWCSFVF